MREGAGVRCVCVRVCGVTAWLKGDGGHVIIGPINRDTLAGPLKYFIF